MRPLPLTEEQRTAFAENGFLVIPDALDPSMLGRLNDAVDRLYAEGLRQQGHNKSGYWEMRNCIGRDPAFLDLLDWPTTVPLVPQLLNWNIQMNTSHIIVRPPSPPETKHAYRQTGWHRDGGTSSREMAEPHPRLMLKISYWLTDLTAPDRGAIRLLPGSHKLIGKPAINEATGDPEGAVEMRVTPGTAVIFEQRVWHAVGGNFSDIPRKSLFFGYGHRWLKAMDYVTQPRELLERAGDPIRRQLLGDYQTELAFYLPTDADVPLRAWLQEQQQAAMQEPVAAAAL